MDKLSFFIRTEEHAVLLDAGTGEWLYLYNSLEPLPPASMSKMMTEILVLDAIKREEISWQDKVRISSYAADVGGATMGLNNNQSITVRELFDALAIHSANDAAVALSERTRSGEASAQPSGIEILGTPNRQEKGAAR